ncbi:hypothetical protein PPERSA_01733 [Pseudocohnilembus persalinus]|uniref:USP domain-containing protein n=1 Tax=Pseudocohnilembus persalinus TaxID=266149 RepID=A0A0V0R1X5_PSEPJ|nr:hypothetical protein PPERSA_01733 [Pseudocohnilembus persalinus]|eukprot:KRX08272.1 hypothetical protein PPERSA_01733 [Pseudocohnilembus persalinus]
MSEISQREYILDNNVKQEYKNMGFPEDMIQEGIRIAQKQNLELIDGNGNQQSSQRQDFEDEEDYINVEDQIRKVDTPVGLKNIGNRNKINIGEQEDIGEFNLNFLERVEEGLQYCDTSFQSGVQQFQSPQKSNDLDLLSEIDFTQNSKKKNLQISLELNNGFQNSVVQMENKREFQLSSGKKMKICIGNDQLVSSLFYGQRKEFIIYEQNYRQQQNESTHAFAPIILDLQYQDLYSSWEAYNNFNLEGFKIDDKEFINAKKEIWMTQVPKNLMFQIQRVQYDQENGSAKKVNEKFYFDKEIYIDRFLLKNRDYISQSKQKLNVLKEKGHYFAYIYLRDQKKWFRYNDTIIKEEKEEDVLEIAYGKGNQSAYCLMYLNESLINHPLKYDFQLLTNIQKRQFNKQLTYSLVSQQLRETHKFELNPENNDFYKIFKWSLLEASLQDTLKINMYELKSQKFISEKLQELFKNMSEYKSPSKLLLSNQDFEQFDKAKSDYLSEIQCIVALTYSIDQVAQQNWINCLYGFFNEKYLAIRFSDEKILINHVPQLLKGQNYEQITKN